MEKTIEPEWLYNSDIDPLAYEGFVYLITNLTTGQMYVGRKSVWTYKKGKRVKESKWRSYWSSSALLKEHIAELGKCMFKREVLHWCIDKASLNFKEVEEQFKREVLSALTADGQLLYYNRNIMSRYFVAPEHRKPVSDATRAKISANRKGQPGHAVSDEHKEKLRALRSGVKVSAATKAKVSAARAGKPNPMSDETKRKLSEARRGAVFSDEHKAKLSEAAKRRRHSPETKQKMSDARRGNTNAKRPDADLPS